MGPIGGVARARPRTCQWWGIMGGSGIMGDLGGLGIMGGSGDHVGFWGPR